MNATKMLSAVIVAAALLGGLVFAWWGWQNLDPSLLLFGSQLC
ncbi:MULTISPECIES: hypothetical protein [Halomonadaceae]|uniref:Uncharacterized protein n=1 Tax=Vreelandella sp. SM1641 TaxID=3126101 RepID=A0AAU7XTI4_9GAMM|nr:MULTISPECIES: hypothetical protein [Halomonas]|tara:strand:- start:2616 stop:2744 length:129 start_codon:yes stop_codon:yes gene_type:complete